MFKEGPAFNLQHAPTKTKKRRNRDNILYF
jgi:hypothetical protein